MKLFDDMKMTVIEREVEDVYNKGISFYFNANITHPFECDGFIDTKVDDKLLKLIMEYKYDKELTSRAARASVIIQVLYYMKRFEMNGMILPNVCLVGDKNECFVFHTNDIIKYLDYDLDWSIAPSDAHKKNPDLIIDLVDNEQINPFVFNINEDFDFGVVVVKIKDLAKNIHRYVHVTEHNIATIFEYFKSNVIKDKKITANELVSVFLGIIKNDNEYYMHPVKKNTLIANKKEYTINGSSYKSFAEYFNRTYTPQEKMRFDEISDRLIEDTNRRMKGEFYTPTIFVDYAHKMISEQFGEDWKEKYVVYDCCCGSLNLTRDYKFKELYCSTLEESELEIGKRYNPEAVKFQFDFLNDYIPMPDDIVDESKIPDGLINAFKENKPIIFFLNPPYATACNCDETSKKGINDTAIKQQMHNNNLGSGAENLQHQFMYRICQIKHAYNLTNVNIALFSNPIYLSGGKQKDFLRYFCDNFKFTEGIMFQASHFADVSGAWGITFNTWKTGKTENINDFNHKLVDNVDGEIKIIGEKDIYNVWNRELASKWVRKEIKGIKTIDLPNTTNGMKIKEVNTRGRGIENELGYFHNNANSVHHNQTVVGFYGMPCAAANGIPIIQENYTKCISLFTSRRLIVDNWTNWTDEYMKPNTEHPKYAQYEADSIIYSLFNNKSNQSSLRNITYKGKQWNIYNHFFWMSRDEIMALANDNNNDDVYNDARTDKDRYTYEMIIKYKKMMSQEAIDVLNKANELVVKSFKYRNLFNEDHPEYQINTWDAGYYQLKALWKEYLNDDFNEFRALYKKLNDKMIPLVYELGFLK